MEVWLLSFLLTISVLLPLLPALPVQAQGAVQQMTNMVVFVKYKSDSQDIFNAVYSTSYGYTYSNWQEIKKMYNGGNRMPATFDNSFSNYISVVTEGKVQVSNYFPQEYVDGGVEKVKTLELSADYYANDDQIITEVLGALQDGRIAVSTSAERLDNVNSGILDNLVIIVQGNAINGNTHAFQTNYGDQTGFDTAYGKVKISTVNMIPSGLLVTEDGSINALQQQGVIAHEFLHTLGLPDLYRSSGDGVPVGMWDVMGGNISELQYPLSYLRAKQGWVSMENITTSGTYTLTAVSEEGGTKVFALHTPLSNSEIICLEYRKRNRVAENGILVNKDRFDLYIPSSGLVMYRVNPGVSSLTNFQGENYIYVYRPGVTDPESAADTDSNGSNLVNQAALDVTAGETEYGSTDLDADYTQNTLYYTGGQNSGIQISNLQLSADGNQLTFTVTFADYGNGEWWDMLGDRVSGQSAGEPMLYTDPATGTLYAACMESSTGSYLDATLCVKRWNGAAWEQIGTCIAGTRTSEPQLAVCGGELYLSYLGGSGNPVYCKLTGSTWSQVYTNSSVYPNNMQFIVDGNEIYGAYQEASGSQNKLVIVDIKGQRVITDSLTARDFSNPALVKAGNCFYMAYSEFGVGKARVAAYDLDSGVWSTVHEISEQQTNAHCITAYQDKIYAFAGVSPLDSPGKAFLAVYNGSGWSTLPIQAMQSFYDPSMVVLEDVIYLSYYDRTDSKGKVLQSNGGEFTLFSDRLGGNLSVLSFGGYGNHLYALTVVQNTADVVVRSKEIPAGSGSTPTIPEVPDTPDIPTPPVSVPFQLKVTPPAGYNDSMIYIDGIPYQAAKEGEAYTLTLPDSSGQAAVMYCYNASGIPTGMYLWKLSWQDNICTAVPLPQLQDLLSYHGFSIRTQGTAGIRFKSGIDTNLRQQLIAGRVDGCHLTEYGTLMMTRENQEKYAFIKGGIKVACGRAYYIQQNGKPYDKILETVGGRDRFTSVLVDMKPNMYARDLSFRSYAILECDGQSITVYGPPVSRSVYTVAKQVQARGEFPKGSSGYQFVQGIIDTVEGR